MNVLDKFVNCYLLFFFLLLYILSLETLRVNLRVAWNRRVHKIINASVLIIYPLLLTRTIILVLGRKI